MALLRPKEERKKRIGKRPFRSISCPYNGHQVSWCMHLCEPYAGRGFCGRLASHHMIGKTRAAVIAYHERTNPKQPTVLR